MREATINGQRYEQHSIYGLATWYAVAGQEVIRVVRDEETLERLRKEERRCQNS